MEKNSSIRARFSRIHGTGVFAVAPIRRGDTIIEYLGERRLWSSYDGRQGSHTELFHVTSRHVLDPKKGGNIARYINHSCTPNCVAVQDGERIFIEALRDIEPGTELCYDYGLVLGRRFTRQDVHLHRCRCGTSRCRGTLLAVPSHRRAQVRRWAKQHCDS